MRCLTLPLFTALILCSASCMKAKGDIEQVEPLRSLLTSQGSWRISYLMVGTAGDSTSEFAGYSFIFSNDGNVSANNQSSSTVGTWSISYTLPAGTSDRLTKLALSLPHPAKFNILTKVWTSTGMDGNTASFQNADNFSTDLTFTKN